MGHWLDARGLICGYDGTTILRGVDLEVDEGDFIGLIGPNGSGKTTLLRAIGRVLKPWEGRILLQGQDIYRTDHKAIAQVVATVPQETPITFGFTVREVVMMGRLPHLKRFAREQSRDIEVVEEAMQRAGAAQLADRSIAELSGGEKQKVIIAQALAQEPRLLLLDEPTSHLDISHQLEILDLIKSLTGQGLAVISVFHELNLAAQYSDRVVLLAGGLVRATGSPEEVITTENLRAHFNVTAVIDRNLPTGRLLVIPMGGGHA